MKNTHITSRIAIVTVLVAGALLANPPELRTIKK
jgi:hypothetical protein